MFILWKVLNNFMNRCLQLYINFILFESVFSFAVFEEYKDYSVSSDSSCFGIYIVYSLTVEFQ
jgi:hypothetical protein